jgi:hypothetical protein
MSHNQEQDDNMDYLWDGSGDDVELRGLEEKLGALRPNAPLRLRIRRAGSTALAVAIAVFALTWAVFPERKVPARFVSLFTEQTVSAIDVEGGSIVEFSVEPADDLQAAQEVAATFERRGARIAHVRDGLVVVELPRIGLAKAQWWADVLSSAGRFEFTLVAETSEYMQRVYQLYQENGTLLDSELNALEARVELDERGAPYLLGTNSQLERAIGELVAQGIVLPAHLRLVKQEVGMIVVGDLEIPTHRTWVVERDAALTREDIERVEVIPDPTRTSTELQVRMNESGTRALADVTSKNLDRHLAIVLDTEVLDVPVIRSPIEGGVASIALGAESPEEQEQLSTHVAQVIASPSGYLPIKRGEIREVGQSVSGWSLLLAKGLLSLLLAFGAFIVAWLASRSMGASPFLVMRRPVAHGRGSVLGRLIFSAAAAFGVMGLLVRISIPGAEKAVAQFYFGGFEVWTAFSMAAVGLVPFVTGYMVAELIARLVPSWRAHRALAGEGDRGPIHKLAISLSLVFMVAQSHALVTWLMNTDGNFMRPYGGDVVYLQAMAYVIGGSVLSFVCASIVTRVGVGNGFAWIFAAASVQAGAMHLDKLGSFAAGSFALTLGTILILALATAFVLRSRVRLINQDGWGAAVTGVLPFYLVPAIGILFALATGADDWAFDIFESAWNNPVKSFQLWAAVGLAAVGAGWVWIDSNRRRGTAWLVGAAPRELRQLAWILLASVGYVSLIIGAEWLLQELQTHTLVSALAFVLATAAGMDVLSEFRARFLRPDLEVVWRLHSVRRCDQAIGHLVRADIEVHVAGRYLRGLLLVAGSFVPMFVRVPAHRADDARELIRSALMAELVAHEPSDEQIAA